jgi:hypothetical protein
MTLLSTVTLERKLFYMIPACVQHVGSMPDGKKRILLRRSAQFGCFEA